jgi:phytoene/squalene synthetase
MNTELQNQLLEFVREHQIAHDQFTERQMAELIRQMLASGDIIRNVRTDGAQNVIYVPYADMERMRSRMRLVEEHAENLALELESALANKQKWWETARGTLDAYYEAVL